MFQHIHVWYFNLRHDSIATANCRCTRFILLLRSLARTFLCSLLFFPFGSFCFRWRTVEEICCGRKCLWRETSRTEYFLLFVSLQKKGIFIAAEVLRENRKRTVFVWSCVQSKGIFNYLEVYPIEIILYILVGFIIDLNKIESFVYAVSYDTALDGANYRHKYIHNWYFSPLFVFTPYLRAQFHFYCNIGHFDLQVGSLGT